MRWVLVAFALLLILCTTTRHYTKQSETSDYSHRRLPTPAYFAANDSTPDSYSTPTYSSDAPSSTKSSSYASYHAYPVACVKKYNASHGRHHLSCD